MVSTGGDELVVPVKSLPVNEEGSAMGKRLSQERMGRVRWMASKAGTALSSGINMTTPNLDPKAPDKEEMKKAGDLHDLFNVAVLPVIVVLVFMNVDFANQPWNRFWWTGKYFYQLWWTTLAYFLVDGVWVLLVPICVKSPAVILIHHAVTILYMVIPMAVPRISWMMGACLVVEVNTWFLIMRRFGNKAGTVPWAEGVHLCTSLRLQFVVVMFYITWVGIRMILYPVMLPLIITEYIGYSKEVGTWLNPIMPAPIMHTVFIVLNLKWSWDLFCPAPRLEPKVGETQMERGL